MDRKMFMREEDKKAEEDAKEMSFRYSLPTLMGNWGEEMLIVEEKVRMGELRRERCEDYVQRKNIATQHLFFRVDIAKYNQFLLYEVPIQLLTDFEASVIRPGLTEQMNLSVTLTEKDIFEDGKLVVGPGTKVTAVISKQRLRKNVFTIMCGDERRKWSPVNYGEDVFIRLFNSGSSSQLFLRCEIPNLDTFGGTKNRFAVHLSDVVDRYSKFRIVPANPMMQMEAEGTPVPSNSRITILHVLSNRLLSVDLDNLIVGLLDQEYAAVCYTFKDIHKGITSENYWICVTKKIGEDEIAADKAAEHLKALSL